MPELAELRRVADIPHEVFEISAIIWFAWRAQRMFAMHANSQRQITRTAPITREMINAERTYGRSGAVFAKGAPLVRRRTKL